MNIGCWPPGRRAVERTLPLGRQGVAEPAFSRYSAAMSDFVRAITTGTKAMTVISIMGITTTPRAGLEVCS